MENSIELLTELFGEKTIKSARLKWVGGQVVRKYKNRMLRKTLARKIDKNRAKGSSPIKTSLY